MIVGVIKDFERTFTGDFFSKLLGKIMIFVFNVSISQTKLGYGPLKNLGEQSRAILPLLLRLYFKPLPCPFKNNCHWNFSIESSQNQNKPARDSILRHRTALNL